MIYLDSGVEPGRQHLPARQVFKELDSRPRAGKKTTSHALEWIGEAKPLLAITEKSEEISLPSQRCSGVPNMVKVVAPW
jgi:hypothetical protein